MVRKVLSQGIHVKYEKALSLTVHIFNMTKVKDFESKSNFNVNFQGQKSWNDVKGLVTRNTHQKYESPVSRGS